MKLRDIAEHHPEYIPEGTDFKALKKNKIKLTDDERDQAMKAGAVWHPSNHPKSVCAIWKSKTAGGKTVFGCNTHRVYQTAPTLKGAIKKFHDVVKDSA